MSVNIFNDLKQVDRNTVTFCLRPVIVSYANALRRAIQTEVSTLGFRADMTEDGSTTDVKILKNSTPMSNEMLADRIGLLPVVMNADTWIKESVLFRLKVVNTSDEVRMVTASDFECLEKRDDAEERVRIPNTQFFHPDPVTGETCLIAVLKPMISGQEPEEVHIEAYASLGKGREHARFNPTSQCSYAYTRDTDSGKIKALFNTWLKEQKKVDPGDLEKDTDRKAVLEREFRSLEIYRCYLQDTEGEPYSYDFTLETVGTLPIQKIMYEALVSLATLVDKYSNIDSGDLPESIEIRPADARLKGYDFWFGGEDHTLGNILQTWLDENEVGGEISFAGYKIPHPLREEMVLRIGVEDGQQDTARGAIARASRSCADMFRTWAVQWSEVSGTYSSSSKIRNPWEAHADTKTLPKK